MNARRRKIGDYRSLSAALRQQTVNDSRLPLIQCKGGATRLNGAVGQALRQL